ncbi:MAG: thiamine pyrophosphate-dependent enzyme, partial [Pediococcus sp.]|nr:thiamine pyrophosphate-dependent enzyme [Pediococcus sp.]
NQDPMFVDVAVFHEQVVSVHQIPYVVDQAIRAAYANKGPAVVIIPDDLSGQEIEFTEFKTAPIYKEQMHTKFDEKTIDHVVSAIQSAKHPVVWAGVGLKGATKELVAVSEKFSLPVLSTVPATGVMPTDHPNFMGSRGRLGTKPGFEVSQMADLVISVGTNYPFLRFLPEGVKVIQVNNNAADIGKQRDVDLAILGDGQDFLKELLKRDVTIEPTDFLKAARLDKQNWDKWLDTLANDDSKGLPAEAVMKTIKAHSTDHTIFGADVGNNTEWAIRQIPLNKNQKFTLSSWFATMGYGLPAGIAGKLSFPDRQVVTISGDGGYAMVMQDLLTEVKYQLPVVNVVLENKVFGFIQHEKIAAKQAPYGIDLLGANWAGIAENMGAIGFTVTDQKSLDAAFDKIDELQKAGNTKPIVVDAKVKNVDPIDTSFIPMDPDQFDQETIDNYKKTYNVFGQPALSEILKNL